MPGVRPRTNTPQVKAKDGLSQARASKGWAARALQGATNVLAVANATRFIKMISPKHRFQTKVTSTLWYSMGDFVHGVRIVSTRQSQRACSAQFVGQNWGHQGTKD